MFLPATWSCAPGTSRPPSTRHTHVTRRTGNFHGAVGLIESGQTVLVGVPDGLRAVPDAGLGEDPVDVGLHRGVAEVEALGDLGVAQYRGEQAEDFGLADGEPVGRSAGAGAGTPRVGEVGGRRTADNSGHEAFLNGR